MKTNSIIISVFFIIFMLFENGFSQELPDTLDKNNIQVYSNNTQYSPENDVNIEITPTNELQDETIWLGGQDAGIEPLDIIYVDTVNKYFVYGYHRIIVIDGNTFEKTGTIDISNYGTSYPTDLNNLANHDDNHFAFNKLNNELYCYTEDLKILIINPATYEITGTITNAGETTNYNRTIIKYDSRTNKIVALFTYQDNSLKTNYYVFDGTQHDLLSFRIFPFDTYSIAINGERDVIYLSTKELTNNTPEYGIQLRNINGDNIINSVNTGNVHEGEILYVNDAGNGIHKAFFFPMNFENGMDAYVVNGDNDQIQTFSFNHSVTSSVYNPFNNKLYCTYHGGITIYNADDYSFIANVTLNPDPSLNEYVYDLKYINNNKLVGCYASNLWREIKNGGSFVFNCSDNSFENISEIPFSFNVRIATDNSNALIINFIDGSAFVLTNFSFNKRIILGGRSRRGIYVEPENKIYTYDPYIGKIYVNDFDDNSSGVIDIGYLEYPEYISSLAYDKDRNRLYVSVYENSNIVRIIDCSTDEILNQQINLSRNYCKYIFYGNNDKLYCTVGAPPNNTIVIDFVDLNTLNVTHSHILNDVENWNYTSWFDFTKDGDIILASNDPGDATNHVMVIQSANDYIYEIYNVPNPLYLAYNPLNDKIYTAHNHDGTQNKITVIDRSSGQINYITTDYNLHGFQYCDKGNYLAVFGNSNISSYNPPPAKIWYFDGKTNDLISEGDVPNFASGIKYNPVNGNLYLIVPFNREYLVNNAMEVYNFNHIYNFTSKITTDMYERDANLYFISNNPAFINTKDNKLIIPTGSHSRLNIIQCDDDEIMVRGGIYNWISFPKLQRDETTDDPVSTQSVMEDLDPLPYSLILEYKTPPPPNAMLHFTKTGGTYFDQELPNVQSSKGYKLSTSNSSTTWLHLHGTRLVPDYTINLKAGGENWIGYFLQQNQSPLDALSPLLPDHLIMAKGYDWTLTDMGAGPDDHLWVVTPADAKIKYGDMVIVEVVNDIDFQWYGFGASGSKSDRNPEHYSYVETDDYTPLLIEPDTTNPPLEIGAFVNDTCIGACVVEPSDTLVLLRAYTQSSGDSIVFENFYGEKSSLSNKKIKEYYVFNHEKRIKEKRIIKTGEGRRFYLISFNDSGKNTNFTESGLSINIFPNPVNKNSFLEINTTQPSNIKLELYDMMGKMISVSNPGFLEKGVHRFLLSRTINLKNIGNSGVYLLKVFGPSSVVSKRVVIIK